MKTAAITLLLALTVAGCGKTPEDPGRYRKPTMPGGVDYQPLLTLPAPDDVAEGSRAPALVPAPPPREPVVRWM